MNINLYIIAPALKLINLYTRCCSRLNRINDSLYTAINIVVSDDVYLFLKDSTFPHDFKRYNEINVKPALLYNMTTNTFYPSSHFLSVNELFRIGTKLPIPILSLEIIDKNKNTLYDLTDFIEPMRYVKLTYMYATPTIGHIVSVWQLAFKVILDESEVSVKYMNRDGDELITDIRNLNSLY